MADAFLLSIAAGAVFAVGVLCGQSMRRASDIVLTIDRKLEPGSTVLVRTDMKLTQAQHAQCRDWLNAQAPNVSFVLVDSTIEPVSGAPA